MSTEPLNAVQKGNLLSQVKYLCSHFQTVIFSFGLGEALEKHAGRKTCCFHLALRWFL